MSTEEKGFTAKNKGLKRFYHATIYSIQGMRAGV